MAALTAKGSTPASNNLEDIVTAINNLKTDVKHSVYIEAWKDGSNCKGEARLYVDGSRKLTIGTSYSNGTETAKSNTIQI